MPGYLRVAVAAALGVCMSFAVLAQDKVTLFHERGAPTATLLVVASGHFANPGRDNVNIKVDDVLAPRRQAEIAELVKRLAALSAPPSLRWKCRWRDRRSWMRCIAITAREISVRRGASMSSLVFGWRRR